MLRLIAVAVSAAVVLTACGSDAENPVEGARENLSSAYEQLADSIGSITSESG
jgi:hypothetical protein